MYLRKKADSRKCIIVDMDGTLADVRPIGYLIKDEGRRDYDEFHRQSLYVNENTDIANAVRAWSAYVPILIVTARSDKFKRQTEQWLKGHGIAYDNLYMRPEGVHCTDEVLKTIILSDVYGDGYDPILAYEDNDSIIKLWHMYGIPTVRGPGW